MAKHPMPVGVVTLGDILPDPRTGLIEPEPRRFRGFVEHAVEAEALGYDSYHLGQHHFSDYALSAPPVLMAAIAERTRCIELSTAVSVVTHDDPVKLAEDYATADLLSGGRVSLIAGRGVYRAHYAQFGQDPDDSEALLVDAVALLKRLWREENVTWQGRVRPPLAGVTTRPRPFRPGGPTVWMSASSPESAVRAAGLHCPIMIPTVSCGWRKAAEIAHRYRQAWRDEGLDPAAAQVGLHLHLFVGEGSSEAVAAYWKPFHVGYLTWVFAEFGRPPGSLPATHSELRTPEAQAVCGNARDVAAEVRRRLALMGGADRLLIQFDHGGLPYDEVSAAMQRFAEQVRPDLEVGVAATT